MGGSQGDHEVDCQDRQAMNRSYQKGAFGVWGCELLLSCDVRSGPSEMSALVQCGSWR